MKSPCKDCPFRKNIHKGWLGKERMTEIVEADSFVCHKTTHSTLEDRKQCAGHMILKKGENSYVRLANNMGMELGLSGDSLIFDSPEECVKHHT